jgi:hypothetical protein
MRTTLTIMPDYCAFCWRSEGETGGNDRVGSCCSLPTVQRGMRKGPHPLEAEFWRWQDRFEQALDGTYPLKLNWIQFHNKGIALVKRLKLVLGNDYRIIYEKPMEDPWHHKQERREVMLDGTLVTLPSRRELEEAFNAAHGILGPQPRPMTFEEIYGSFRIAR